MNVYEKFDKVMEKHSALAVTRDMLRYAFAGKERIPQNARAWDIYTSKQGSDSVAKELTEAAEEMVEHILNTPLSQIGEEKEKASSVFSINDWEIWD